jgi:serine phosphatase RsbU (regulator of sigma subunit)
MTRDRTQVLGAGLALLVLALLAVVDAFILPNNAVITPLFGMAPLIACAVVPARGTAVIAGLAVIVAILSGAWDDAFGTPQQNVRVLNVVLVGSAAVAIAAVRVRRERRFAQVSEIAQVAQSAILPVLPAQAAHVAIAARYQSAARDALVGGDLYDCYHSDEHIRLLVGDVRGKGIAGVEQAARVIRAFRQSAALRPTLAEVAEEMDRYLAGFFEAEEFVTALLVDVTEPRMLRMVSAGHPGPQLVRATGAEVLELPQGLPLGVGLPSDSYAETTMPWSPGDRLLMYTDGLSEARDSLGEFLPISSLDSEVRSGTVQRAVEEVVATATRHVPRGRLEDDLAVVVIEHLPGGPPAGTARDEDAATSVAGESRRQPAAPASMSQYADHSHTNTGPTSPPDAVALAGPRSW